MQIRLMWNGFPALAESDQRVRSLLGAVGALLVSTSRAKSRSSVPPGLIRSATRWRVGSLSPPTVRALSPHSCAAFTAASTIAWASARRGSALFFSGLVFKNSSAMRRLPRRIAGEQGGSLQRPNPALKLRWLLRVDLDAERRDDLAHTVQRCPLFGNGDINLPDAEIGEEVRLIDRPRGVPDIWMLSGIATA